METKLDLELKHNRRKFIDFLFEQKIVYQSNLVLHDTYNVSAREHVFLRTVDILKNLTDSELSKLSESVKRMKFKKNDYVIREGEVGDTFYIVV